MSKQDGSNRQVSGDDVDDSATPILHVDLDAFFAAVAILANPSLAGKPVIVGGHGPRSVVSAANYEARRFGVNSAMPMVTALQRCPQAVVVPIDGPAYQRYSGHVMSILHEVTPLVEQLSIDEAFLDVAGVRRLWGSPVEIGRTLRDRVRHETGLTISVGIAATKFVAKVASSLAKPDGLLVVPANETVSFLRPLPISALGGVGTVTANKLQRLGVGTIGDVADTPLEVLSRILGAAGALRLSQLSRGIDDRAVERQRIEKSVGHETTFRVDVDDRIEIERVLLSQSEDVARRLRAAGARARTVVLKLRFSDFRTITRSRTLSEPTDVAKRIHEEAIAALANAWEPGALIRLVGVRGENLIADDSGPALWDPDEDWRHAERTMDDVSEKFGLGAIAPASLLRQSRRSGTGFDERTGRGLEHFDGETTLPQTPASE